MAMGFGNAVETAIGLAAIKRADWTPAMVRGDTVKNPDRMVSGREAHWLTAAVDQEAKAEEGGAEESEGRGLGDIG